MDTTVIAIALIALLAFFGGMGVVITEVLRRWGMGPRTCLLVALLIIIVPAMWAARWLLTNWVLWGLA